MEWWTPRAYKSVVFFGITLILGSVLLIQAAWFVRRMPLKTIKIHAPFHHVSKEHIESEISAVINDGSLAISLDALRNKMLALPWIADVHLRRQWPDTLKISLAEKQPVARWNNQGLLTKENLLFTPDTDTQGLGLIELRGPNIWREEALSVSQKLSTMLATHGLRLVGIELSETKAWSLTLADGTKVLVGRGEPVVLVKRFLDAYSKILSTANGRVMEQVDLRHPRGMSVRWRKSYKTK